MDVPLDPAALVLLRRHDPCPRSGDLVQLLGELRGAETFTFLQAINTGHPGSLTTVHANSPRAAYERLALMVMQGGVSLAKADVLAYLEEVIPVVVQLGRENGNRIVSEILFAGNER